MVVAVYVSLYTLIIVWLSLRVINRRREHRVSVGDGGVGELQFAMGAHSNAVECLVPGALLLVALELNGGSLWLLHGLGAALLAGRALHIYGMARKKLAPRVRGMKITLFSLVALAVANLVYLPYFGN